MADVNSKMSEKEELKSLLLLDILNPIEITLENCCEETSNIIANVNSNYINNLTSAETPQQMTVDLEGRPWGKCLIHLPVFTIKEIEEHRLKSGKTPNTAIIKTLDRGIKFKHERYLSADSIFTQWDDNKFYINGKCKASMKKDKRNITVTLDKINGKVVEGKCSCPAGQSGYCNHVMALLFEIADYSLSQLKNVPEEIACTSRLRQWGIPGESSSKAPVLETVIQKQVSSKGISSTLYDPRKNESKQSIHTRILKMETSLQAKDKNIGFACCVTPVENRQNLINTKYGKFIIGSPLSFHLNPVGFSTEIDTNINNVESSYNTEHYYIGLPMNFIVHDHEVIPQSWNLSEREKSYLKTIQINKKNSQSLERDTANEKYGELWTYSKRNKINSSDAHKIFIRKKNFESITDQYISQTQTTDIPATIRDALKHSKMYEPIALEKYVDIIRFKLNRDVEVREAGCLIQPNLFWLVASPCGLISDKSIGTDDTIGLIEIKCPKTKRNCGLQDLLKDESFFVAKVEGKLVLKRNHPNGYYTQIQMNLGLAGAKYCDFVVYTFRCMIIIRISFDIDYFIEMVPKLNEFYRNYMLPKVSDQYHNE